MVYAHEYSIIDMHLIIHINAINVKSWLVIQVSLVTAPPLRWHNKSMFSMFSEFNTVKYEQDAHALVWRMRMKTSNYFKVYIQLVRKAERRMYPIPWCHLHGWQVYIMYVLTEVVTKTSSHYWPNFSLHTTMYFCRTHEVVCRVIRLLTGGFAKDKHIIVLLLLYWQFCAFKCTNLISLMSIFTCRMCFDKFQSSLY